MESSQIAEVGHESTGFVLNAPRSSAIAVNAPVSARGLYKSDDDQTHSDDLCCRNGGRGSEFVCAGAAGLSGATRAVYSSAPRFARRLSVRLSPRSGPPISIPRKTTKRRTRRVRPRCRRPARCCRRMIRAMAGRWALRRLFRPQVPGRLSPDDPRYGRPTSLRSIPTAHADRPDLMPPDDPRYGRPSGPPVIYAARPPVRPIQAYRR